MISQPEVLDDAPLPQLPSTEFSDTSGLSSKEKVLRIRTLMKKHHIGVYLVPSEDEHQSEETSAADKRREWLSGFTGSAGICVITLDDGDSLSGEAALLTDGRYFLQAEKQLDLRTWKLLKQGMAGFPLWQEFALTKASESSFSNVISVDPKLLSLYYGEYFESMLSFRGVKFLPLSGTNLVDEVWENKPARLPEPVYSLPLEFSGELALSKILRVRKEMSKLGGSHLIISALDDIGWLLNLRSDTDIPFSPFFFSYVVVTYTSVTLYAAKKKLQKVKEHLAMVPGLEIRPYRDFYGDLSTIRSSVSNPDVRLILPSKDACNYGLLAAVPSSVAKRTIVFDSIVAKMKLTKNKTELFNANVAQTKDSLAFIIFSAWLEYKLVHEKSSVNEWQAAQKIYDIRLKLPNFKGLSYETISSTGPNAAIIHYAPNESENLVIDPKVPYLIDSGAHYLEGTTDITRTYKFGEDNLTERYRKFYTLVLKGHIAVAMAKFPSGSTATGTVLDAYARQPLWNEGLDFNHGTGHGVGSFGNVHEGPLFILTTAGGASSADYFKKGAILTDEPGYYVDGECGFRVESEIEVVECSTDFGKTRSGGKYLGFRYMTKVPFCLKLIDTKYLTPLEKGWINEFHSTIREELVPKLLKMGESRASAWLIRETRSI